MLAVAAAGAVVVLVAAVALVAAVLGGDAGRPKRSSVPEPSGAAVAVDDVEPAATGLPPAEPVGPAAVPQTPKAPAVPKAAPNAAEPPMEWPPARAFTARCRAPGGGCDERCTTLAGDRCLDPCFIHTPTCSQDCRLPDGSCGWPPPDNE